MPPRPASLLSLVCLASLIACGSPSPDPVDDPVDAGVADADDPPPDMMPPPDMTPPPDMMCVDEVCNGVDDDCDGLIDEALGLGDVCEVGIGECARTGTYACGIGDAVVCSAVAGLPADETCNGLDDDCDGSVDDVAGLGDSCDSAVPGVCSVGAWACAADGLVCAPLEEPGVESCNALDDDCDGDVDDGDPEGGLACTTGWPGRCALGTSRCAGGDLVCDQTFAPRAELCDSVDDDCDGDVDEQCKPDAPVIRGPWSGFQTGSPWAHGAPGVAAKPLAPTFRWSAPQGALMYEFQLDDSCTSPATCTFPAPEISVAQFPTSYTPFGSGMAHSEVAPVGRRYYFRARGCNQLGCGAWSTVHYVDLGRVDGDVNGDGYPDLLVAASITNRVYVFHGSATGLDPTPARILTSYAVDGAQMAGDLNADGFGDVVIGNYKAGTYQGIAHVYLGSTTGLPETPSQTITSPIAGTYVFFGNAHGAGDVDGDGYADLVIGAPGANDTGTAFLFYGSPDGVDLLSYQEIPTPMGGVDGFFGDAVGGVGDVDADGLADFAIGDPDRRRDGAEAGAVAVYRGAFAGPSTTPLIRLENPDHPARRWYGDRVGAAGDVNGDGYADLMTTPRTGLVGTPYPGRVYVHHGGPAGLAAAPSVVIQSPSAATNTAFAADLVGGVDVDGDGRAEVLAGDWLAATDQAGLAYLFSAAATAPFRVFVPLLSQYTGHFGASAALCDLDSDGHGDVVLGQLAHGTPETGAIFVYPGGASGPSAEPALTITDPQAGDNYFGVSAACRR